MEKQINVWLADIQQGITEIHQFLLDTKTFSDFKKDIKAKRAIERNIEIIGEAMKRILVQNPNITIESARKIVDTRNRISHGYDSVSDDIIWVIVTRDIPKLKKR